VTTLLFVCGLTCGASAQTPSGLSPAFNELLTQYRTGDTAAAIVAFSRWPEARVIAESTKFEGIADRSTLAAIALFHTEAGIVNGKFGDIAAGKSGRILLGGWGLEDVFEPHARTANLIVDQLLDQMKVEKVEAFWRFGLDWYVVAMSTCQYRRHFACTVELLDKGESYFEDQGRYRLIQGSVTAPAYRTPEAITLAD